MSSSSDKLMSSSHPRPQSLKRKIRRPAGPAQPTALAAPPVALAEPAPPSGQYFPPGRGKNLQVLMSSLRPDRPQSADGPAPPAEQYFPPGRGKNLHVLRSFLRPGSPVPEDWLDDTESEYSTADAESIPAVIEVDAPFAGPSDAAQSLAEVKKIASDVQGEIGEAVTHMSEHIAMLKHCARLLDRFK